MPRLLIANLECEQDWATPEQRPRALPRDVLERISAAGTLMAALGRPGDLLWTPRPVARERAHLAHELGIRLLFGPREELAHAARDAEDIIAWGETRWVQRLRASSGLEPEPERHGDPESARQCNDRRYAFALNQASSQLLPGARILSSLDELEAHLRAGGHAHGHHFGHGSGLDERTWVLEAPFSASGRLRLRRRGPRLDRAARTRAARLFATFGQLVFQPWVDRTLDVGVTGVIAAPDRWTILGHHTLECDRAGVFRGIQLGPTDEPQADTVTRVRAFADHVARHLATDGYRGPFGIDGFAYRDPAGEAHVYPLCEINARTTFGRLAHELQRRHPSARMRLALTEGGLPPASERFVPLLAPGRDHGVCAWLDLRPYDT